MGLKLSLMIKFVKIKSVASENENVLNLINMGIHGTGLKSEVKHNLQN